MQTVSTRFRWALLVVLVSLASLLLWLSPSEKTLGQVVKIVYLHGALSRVGMLGFVAAGAAGLIYLFRPRPSLAQWVWGLGLTAWLFWAAHFVVSMPATRLTWGPWVAWSEPRVVMTLQVLAAGAIVLTASWLIRAPRFTAAAHLALGIAVALLVVRTGVIRHPLNPIGESTSSTVQVFYGLLVLSLTTVGLLIAEAIADRQIERYS